MSPLPRIIPGVRPEIEWLFLVNETYAGERIILGLLRDLLKSPFLVGSLREKIEIQLDEEINHVRMYNRLVGKERLSGTGYEDPFSNYISSLPSVSLRLFGLQGMFEGVGLGNLVHRLKYFADSPSQATDTQALREEEGHVSFSHPFFSEVIAVEGVVSREAFRKVAHDINRIFTESFNGAVIARSFLSPLGITQIDPSAIETSPGMRVYRANGARLLAQSKREFIHRYYASAGR